ncbi:hypothetical protein [Heyndrickxia sporothermodurans]|uniref:hypothetical protein n=1 Tax=Heyndrickxia sporothermodurans TaxID=46224 RepID=UPI000D3DB836|nr:hypothetical protein [Heyndrickxia sporothermodurans]PTY93040.1 hypothetical protein B5V90_02855 [Heyndrickxia sporothermodurans]
MNIEITKREVLVSISIVLIMVGLGFLIATKVHDYTMSSNEKYFKALKVDNDPELFQYAIDTEVGNLVSYGTVKAKEPVSDPMIDGKYFDLTKIEEHYVMKTRTVTYTDSNGKTQTKTETYWEWEEYDRWYSHTDTFTYLGQTYDFDFIKFSHDSYIDTYEDGMFSDVRYKFYGIPSKFNGSLYSKATKKTIANNTFHYGQTIKQLMSQKENEASHMTIFFWILWTFVIGLAVFGFVALDNKFLNAQN